MADVIEQLNTNYSKYHFQDPADKQIYKFESVSAAYCLAWLEDHNIVRAKLLYFCDPQGNVIIQAKNYKPN